MATILTANLTDARLDWAVAKAAGRITSDPFRNISGDGIQVKGMRVVCNGADGEKEDFAPSTDWAHGGPIMDLLFRAGLHIHTLKFGYPSDAGSATVAIDGHYRQSGPTILVAAMRCFVEWMLGEAVNVPDELAV